MESLSPSMALGVRQQVIVERQIRVCKLGLEDNREANATRDWIWLN